MSIAENQETNFNFNYMDKSKENPKADDEQNVAQLEENYSPDGQEDLDAENAEMLKNSTEREQAEKEFKFVIIGGNEPKVNDVFMKSIQDANMAISIFELTNDEMKFIINSRAEKKAEETAVEYLADGENKKRIDDWVKILIQNHLNRNYRGKELEELIKAVVDGNEKILFNKKQLKEASKLSWSNFNELFNNLELFGVVNYKDIESKSEFYLISNESDILKNQFQDLKQFVNLTIGKVVNLQNESKLKSVEKKNLESIKKSLLKVVDKI